jgi:uncharacterized protein YjbJ (UPF0337 family)
VEGKIKETAGRLVGNEKLQVEDKVRGILGAAQAKFGDSQAGRERRLEEARMTA